MINRIVGLDALRGLAALVVVFYHYLYRYSDIYGNTEIQYEFVKFGYLGVQLFFVISGFVIFWSIQNIQHHSDFIISRFSRLFPTYWTAILMTFIIVSILGLPGREVFMTDALLNMLMFHKILGVPDVDGVYWTLLSELLFYVFIFVLIITKKLKLIEYALLIVVLAAFTLKYSTFWGSPFIKMHLTQPFIFFSIGVCFYKIKAKLATRVTYVLLVFSMLTSFWLYGLYSSIILLSIYLVFSLVIFGKMKFLSHPALLFLGAISYPLYLVHQNIGYSIMRYLYSLDFPFLLTALIAIIISIFLATILNKFIEKPATKLIRTIYKSRKKRSLCNI